MSTTTFVSGYTVINSLFRNLKIDFEEWENDAMVWMFEALNFIGTIHTKKPAKEVLTVKDFRSTLPAGFKYIRRVYHHEGMRIPFKKDMDFMYAIKDDPVFVSKDFPKETRTDKKSFYYIEPNFLKFSFQKGLVDLYYYSYPTDKTGFPLVPDNPYLKQSLQYYIMRMMSMSGYEFRNKAFTFQSLDALWESSKVQAANDLEFPSPEENMDFISESVTMYPNYDL